MFNLFSSIPSISTNDLQKKLTNQMILLDVRTSSEYQSGHIRQAKNVPLNKIDKYKQKGDQDIYVICQSGARSKQAAQQLKKNDYNVINVRGGMNQWQGPVRGGK